MRLVTFLITQAGIPLPTADSEVPDNAPWPGAEVHFERIQGDHAPGVVRDRSSVTAKADAEGRGQVALLPGRYSITLPSGDVYRRTLEDSPDPIDLADWLALGFDPSQPTYDTLVSFIENNPNLKGPQGPPGPDFDPTLAHTFLAPQTFGVEAQFDDSAEFRDGSTVVGTIQGQTGGLRVAAESGQNLLVQGDEIESGSPTGGDAEWTHHGGLSVTGNISGKLEDAGGAVANVRAFGAVGDGIADDSAALTAASALGTTVVLPAGTYRIASNIELTGDWEFAPGVTIVPDSGVELRIGSGCRIRATGEWLDLSAGGTVAYEAGTFIVRTVDVQATPTAAPNLQLGFPGNVIDPAVGACVVMQGTQSFPHSIAAGADLSVIAGSYDNHIHENAIASTIAGGAHHNIYGSHGTILGGAYQIVTGSYGVAVAGTLNNCYSQFGFVGGGHENTAGTEGDEANQRDAVVVGGTQNNATAFRSIVGGGALNDATAEAASILGGENNTASADYSTVGGGLSNQATAAYATVAGGQLGVASGANAAVAGGVACVASGPYAFAVGQNSTASGPYAVATGARSKADKYGQRSHASGYFSAFGDAQISELVARRETTTATTAPLGLFGGNQPITLPDNTTWAFTIMVVARRTDVPGENAAYEFKGCIARDEGAATTALVGTVAKTVIAEDSEAWDANVVADTTNGALQINVTSEAGKTIRWVARIELVEVSG